MTLTFSDILSLFFSPGQYYKQIWINQLVHDEDTNKANKNNTKQNKTSKYAKFNKNFTGKL